MINCFCVFLLHFVVFILVLKMYESLILFFVFFYFLLMYSFLANGVVFKVLYK